MSSEMEAIWLATANSDLRSEQRELEAKIERLEAENFRSVTEIERLERWKTDATFVINAWEEAWELAAVPDNLGATKSEAMLDEITRLRAKNKADFAEYQDRMKGITSARNHWHDLADQMADALRDEARNHALRGNAARALDAYGKARREVTGAERYFAARLANPEYRQAYNEARRDR